jgi:hypothetical protein
MSFNFFDIADAVLAISIVLGTPAYLSLQGWSAWRLTGGWRLAALLPAAFLCCALVECLSGAVGGLSTLMFFPPLATLYLAATIGLAVRRERLLVPVALLPVEG